MQGQQIVILILEILNREVSTVLGDESLPSLQEEPGHIESSMATGHHQRGLVVLVPAVYREAGGQCWHQRFHITMTDSLVQVDILTLWNAWCVCTRASTTHIYAHVHVNGRRWTQNVTSRGLSQKNIHVHVLWYHRIVFLANLEYFVGGVLIHVHTPTIPPLKYVHTNTSLDDPRDIPSKEKIWRTVQQIQAPLAIEKQLGLKPQVVASLISHRYRNRSTMQIEGWFQGSMAVVMVPKLLYYSQHQSIF